MAANLFEKYGGFATISKVVMVFYDKALDSDVLGPYFDGIDMKRLIDHQTKFVATVMGGPASYTNENLREVHAHLHITHDAMAEMLELLEETLDDFDVARPDIETILTEFKARGQYVVAEGDG